MLNLIRDNKTLVIDDDRFVRDSMKAMFNNGSKNMYSAVTAEEALQMVNENGYFLIFCDYKLPGMNGIEFFARVQELDDKPILILITGNWTQRIEHRAFSVGVDAIIEKPLSVSKIESALEGIMRKRE
ncbi:MAG: response regulator [candidate division Zixibacteria bacterium]|nr:response regulator [candidate division Zixibacteria bacterium]